MSHIVIKKVQQSLMTPSIPSHIKIFSNLDDNGELYTIDEFGTVSPIGVTGGSQGISVELTTYNDLFTKAQTDQLGTGSCYLITDFESWYDQPDFHFDGTPKHPNSIVTKASPLGVWPQPILVQAISKRDISLDAYQPYFDSNFTGYLDDSIKYDFKFNYTEITGTPARGKIVERVDRNGNRTDYDHRNVRFIRYKTYERGATLAGTITDFDCTTGEITGSSTYFTTTLNPGDVIILDSYSELGYEAKFKVQSIVTDTQMFVYIDSLYSGGVPSPATVANGYNINPVNYSFPAKNFVFYNGVDTGLFNSYKESWFGQRSNGADLVDYDENVSPFGVLCRDNKFGNHLSMWRNGAVPFSLPNNVIGDGCSNNSFSNYCYNNDFGDSCSNNTITSRFYDNIIDSAFRNSTISSFFSRNIISNGFVGNQILSGEFSNNTIGTNFFGNVIKKEFISNTTIDGFNSVESDVLVTTIDFSSSTYVYLTNLTKKFILVQGGATRLLYFDGTGTPVVVAINA